MLDVHERLYGKAAPFILGIPAYTFFVVLGIVAGLIYYFTDLSRKGQASEGAIKIVFSALIFGVIGAKIPLLFEGRGWEEILYDKSIVGGLVGGMFGVVAVKRIFRIRLKLGNVIAPSIALGMAIGRLGCFFNGCCYGKIATWGFDFGDGFPRLPTQLFEVGFHVVSFILLLYYKGRVKTAGLLFKLYVLAYFIFRFLIEFIRENPVIWAGMTIYQIICGLGIIYITTVLLRRRENGGEQ
ncbi:MAG: prolipoprotein diacylglyceryl transferase [Desulfobulbaceae bacterium]|jgi:phosphatidylglycerol:prolipoprotein diacylglycerol transferase|nr:prolipoprotein diacylglyceryl transferase [Desulfobulbaceae bacterium]